MSGPTCQPVIFGPGITPHCPALPWWDPSHLITARLGWWITAFIIVAWIITAVWTWAAGRWERTCGRPRFIRRWYRAGSVVRDRDTALDGMYRVLTWCDIYTAVPWLMLEEITDDEDADPLTFWGPVTSYASVTVRTFRPRLERFDGHRLPRLFDERPLPGAVAIWRGES